MVLGARAGEAVPFLEGGWHVVADEWARGMGHSLRAGLRHLVEHPLDDFQAALVHVVDVPDVGPDAIARVAAHVTPSVLARATYRGAPGHPVLLGREHWGPIETELAGDEGARRYLERNAAAAIECGDLATGRDVDTPDQLHTLN